MAARYIPPPVHLVQLDFTGSTRRLAGLHTHTHACARAHAGAPRRVGEDVKGEKEERSEGRTWEGERGR